MCGVAFINPEQGGKSDYSNPRAADQYKQVQRGRTRKGYQEEGTDCQAVEEEVAQGAKEGPS